MLKVLPQERAWPGLMRQAQDGDQLAYGLVLRAMLPAIRSIARRRIFDDTLIEDVVQDTLLTVHKLRHTYDPSLPLLPWIAAITSARAIDALRKCGRSQRREVTDEDALSEAVDMRACEPIDGLATQQQLSVLLGRLPARQRRIVEMVKLQEMTLDDAATESSLSIAAVKSLLHRAFAKMREHGTH